MKRLTATVFVALSAGSIAVPVHAQNPDPTDIRACTAIESDSQRLACYDHATGRVNLPVAQKRGDPETGTPSIFNRDRRSVGTTRSEERRVGKECRAEVAL